jgi:hypothetical protein
VDLGRWLDGSYRVPGPPAESTAVQGAGLRDPRTRSPDPRGLMPEEED